MNLIAAGPLRTITATSIRGLTTFEDSWQERAPLDWDTDDASAAGRAIRALSSGRLPTVTGEVIRVDGGARALGQGITRREQDRPAAFTPAAIR